MVVDKQIIQQVFGAVMKEPSILTEVDNYSLSPDDFPSTFEKAIFIAMANLANDGMRKISVIDIDNYLEPKKSVYEIFNKYNGVEYLQDAEEIGDLDNFRYYYTKLKKINAVNDLKNLGFDTNKIYPEGDFLENKHYEQREAFEKMNVEDIFSTIRIQLSKTEERYGCGSVKTAKATKGIEALLQKLKESPEVGPSCQGKIFNTIARGARKGKMYLLSAGSGVGKTRTMIGNACYIAYPIRYDMERHEWVSIGSCEKVMYIGTEQELPEIQTLILAYLSGVNEEKILHGTYNDEEADVLNKSIEIMKIYEDNFTISQLPEPNLTQVKKHIRTHALSDGIQYVFYDYIFVTPSLLNEFRDLTIRPDVALRMLSTLLKDMAVENNIFIMTATQITGEMEFKMGHIRDNALLRDSKSIPDKVDIAVIKARVQPEELNMLSKVCSKTRTPNQVTDVYKNRQGKYVNVRIWSCVDLGTCRMEDLFVTDAMLNEVPNFEIKHFLFDYEETSKVDENLKLLNTGEVDENIEKRFVKSEDGLNWDNLL